MGVDEKIRSIEDRLTSLEKERVNLLNDLKALRQRQDNQKSIIPLDRPSLNKPEGLPDLRYPLHDRTVTVTYFGRICHEGKKINFSRVFAGQDVGIRQVDDKFWLVSFMDYDLGFFDTETCRVEAGQNPFGSKVLPMCSV